MVGNISGGPDPVSGGQPSMDNDPELDASVDDDKGSAHVNERFKQVAALLSSRGEMGILKLLKAWEKHDDGKLDELSNMGVDELLSYANDAPDSSKEMPNRGDVEEKAKEAAEKAQTNEPNSPETQFQRYIMQDIKMLEEMLAFNRVELMELKQLLKKEGPTEVLKKIEAKIFKLAEEGREEAEALRQDEKKLKTSIQGFIINSICVDAAEVLHLTMENLHEYDLSVKVKDALRRLRDEKHDMQSEINEQRRSQELN